MKDAIAPTSFITMSYYSMIAAALQRRVYLGSDERPLFPNMYIILIGDPGVGKGIALDPIVGALRTHKLLKMQIKKPDASSTTQEQADALAALIAEMETSNGKEPNGNFKKMTSMEEPLMFPLASNAITYEALVKTHSQSLRSIFPEVDKNSKLLKSGLYTHSSLSFVLEEISSLFRKHTEDVVQYLITAFDCKDYKYTTIGRGSDRVINSCLNLVAGTTPSFMKETFNDRLLNDGFASRVLFVYAEKNRFYRFDVSSMDESQFLAKKQVVDHLGNLGKLFGKVSYSPDAHAFMKYYIEDVLGEQRAKTNNDSKLIYYYSRKNIHIQKLITAMHFSETTDMVINHNTCEKAVALLDSIELSMHLALSTASRNPLRNVADKVLKALEEKPMDKAEIWAKFFSDITTPVELESLCEYLTSTGKVKQEIINGKFRFKVIK
jgi:hypothetical protein